LLKFVTFPRTKDRRIFTHTVHTVQYIKQTYIQTDSRQKRTTNIPTNRETYNIGVLCKKNQVKKHLKSMMKKKKFFGFNF
jgi:hypothetical protein